MLKRVFSKKNYYLLRELVRTDFKLRYQGSFLGYLWTLLKPLLLFAILFTVFTKFLRIGQGVPNYPYSLLLGVVLWSFFVEATTQSLKSIVNRGSLIRKINIPRYMIPASAVISAFINMALNLVVVFIFVVASGKAAFSWDTLVLLPLLILELTTVAVATGLFLAAAYVRFRDIDHIWEVVRQALFYTVPIIYPLSIVPPGIQKLIILNPLAQILQHSRQLVTYRGTETVFQVYGGGWGALVPFGLVLAALAVGVAVFRKESKFFAENI